jgi:hypothetical protein
MNSRKVLRILFNKEKQQHLKKSLLYKVNLKTMEFYEAKFYLMKEYIGSYFFSFNCKDA